MAGGERLGRGLPRLADAQAARREVWAGESDEPWEWRRRQETKATDTATPGRCRIKGNINREGERIYHMPGGQWYDQTKIDPTKDERWFCIEAEAAAAGWRPAKQ